MCAFKPSNFEFIYTFLSTFKLFVSPFIFSSKPSILTSISSNSFLASLYETENCCTSSHNFDVSCWISSSSCIIIEHFEGLIGVAFFFLGGIFELINDIYASLFPLNHL